MADFSSWGPAQSGFRLAEQDSLQKYAIQAQTAHQQALAQEAQMRANEQQRLTQAMMQMTTPDGQGGPGAGGSLADIIENQAVQLSRLGFPAKAGDLGVKAATIRMHEAQQEHQKSSAAALDAGVRMKTLDRISQLYGQARDEQSWAAANMMVAQQFPDFDNPLAKVPYSPQAAQAAANQALSLKDKIALGIKQQQATSQDQLRQARESFLASRAEIFRAQQADRERRTDLLEKNGGSKGANKPVGSPSNAETRAAATLLANQLPGNLPPGELQSASFQIAADAKAWAKANPGLSMGDAMNQAVAEALKSGDFQTTAKMFGKPDLKYNPAGKSPETALAPPEDRKFQAGRFYNTPKGVMKFDGKSWFPATAAKPAAGKPAALVQAADEGDDGEEE